MKTSQKDLFEGFPFPKTNEQEVLLTLILQGHTSFFDFNWMQGYRTRVSQLQSKYGLSLDRTTDTRHNKFGNIYTYAIYRLPESQKEKAVELYTKLTSVS